MCIVGGLPHRDPDEGPQDHPTAGPPTTPEVPLPPLLLPSFPFPVPLSITCKACLPPRLIKGSVFTTGEIIKGRSLLKVNSYANLSPSLPGSLNPCSSQWGPWTSSIRITWELVRNVESQALPRPAESEPAF